MQKINHYIDGTNFEGNSGKTSDVYNPATGEVSAKVCLANSNETKKAIDVAAKAFQGWASTPPLQRARILFKFTSYVFFPPVHFHWTFLQAHQSSNQIFSLNLILDPFSN